MNWKAWFTKKPVDAPKEEKKEEEFPLAKNGCKKSNGGSAWIERKLKDEELHFMMPLIASFTPSTEIQERLLGEFGTKITTREINFYKSDKRWKPYIEKLRAVWLQGIMEEPIANKRIRLQRLEECYKGAIGQKRYREAVTPIKEAREEMEPKNPNYQIQMNQFNFLSDDELLELRDKLKNKIKTVEVNDEPE